jgi:hypothetical protein
VIRQQILRGETYVWHDSLKTHILDTSNILGTLEVLACSIFPTFSGIVHEVLCHLTKSSAFFTEINNDTTTTLLSLFDCLFYAKDEVGAASANVGTEDIAAVTFVVNAQSESDIGIGHFGRVAEYVNSQTANGGEEELDVMAGDELRVGSACLFE